MSDSVLVGEVFDELYYRHVDEWAQALKYRTLGDLHFEAIKRHQIDFRQKLGDASEDPNYFSHFVTTQGLPRSGFSYYQPYGRHVQPCFVGIGAHKTAFMYSESWLPLKFDLSYLGRRYARQRAISFDAPRIDNILRQALLFSRVIDNVPHFQNRIHSALGQSLVLYDKAGLFLAHARSLALEDQQCHIHLLRWRNNGGYWVGDPKPPAPVKAEIFVNQFVPYRDLQRDKLVLYHQYQALFEQPHFQAATAALASDFKYPFTSRENHELGTLAVRSALSKHRVAEDDLDRLIGDLRRLLLAYSSTNIFNESEVLPDPGSITPTPPRRLPLLSCMNDARRIPSSSPFQDERTQLEIAAAIGHLPPPASPTPTPTNGLPGLTTRPKPTPLFPKPDRGSDLK